MSVDDAREPFRQALERAIRAAGLDPLGVDKVHHNEIINDFIMANIREAKVLLAEFTDHKAGVYFEAGFALGLGKPVIFVCSKMTGKRGTSTRNRSTTSNGLRWTNWRSR